MEPNIKKFQLNLSANIQFTDYENAVNHMDIIVTLVKHNQFLNINDEIRKDVVKIDACGLLN